MPLTTQDPTGIYTDNGLVTQYGIDLPPGARLAGYVRSTGVQTNDSAFVAANLNTTLAAALAKVRPGFGDFVVCLPGHAENVADATTISGALVAGAKIIGYGQGGNTPTFTFTATTSSIAVSVNDVVIAGCRFLLDGINAVANAFNITASDFLFTQNDVECSTTAKAAAIVMTLGTGANRANITGNVFRGLASVPCTNGILVSGAITDARIVSNEMIFPTTTTNGLINVTGIALGLKVLSNVMYNTVAASTTCVAYAAVASDGILANNFFAVLNNGTASAQGVTFGAGCLVKAFQNFCSDEPQKSGILSPVGAT